MQTEIKDGEFDVEIDGLSGEVRITYNVGIERVGGDLVPYGSTFVRTPEGWTGSAEIVALHLGGLRLSRYQLVEALGEAGVTALENHIFERETA